MDGLDPREPTPLLSVRHLSKSFGAVTAVDDVSLDIMPNEVVGIVGDNAAGKSTFLSLLTGYHQCDRGEFYYRGQPVEVSSPATSRRNLKIEMIYQNLSLAPDLEVWKNIFLGEEVRRFGWLLDRRTMVQRSRDALARLNAKARPQDIVGTLSGGEQQTVAIARTLVFDRELIIFDEPTAAISLNKVRDVLQLIRDLKQHGKSVLLVSHRLEDILEVSDRIVVFSHGRIKAIVPNRDIDIEDLVRLMFENRGGDASA